METPLESEKRADLAPIGTLQWNIKFKETSDSVLFINLFWDKGAVLSFLQKLFPVGIFSFLFSLLICLTIETHG